MKMLRVSIFFFTFFLFGLTEQMCSADSTEAWVRRAGQAATQLTSGNIQSAASQIVPSAHTQISKQTSLNAGLSGVGLHQKIAPIDRLSTKYLSLDGGYNVGSSVNFNQHPNISQNFQVSARNPYFTNSTTFIPKLPRKQ